MGVARLAGWGEHCGSSTCGSGLWDESGQGVAISVAGEWSGGCTGHSALLRTQFIERSSLARILTKTPSAARLQSPHLTPTPTPLQLFYRFQSNDQGEAGTPGMHSVRTPDTASATAAARGSRESLSPTPFTSAAGGGGEGGGGAGGGGSRRASTELSREAEVAARLASRQISAALEVELASPLQVLHWYWGRLPDGWGLALRCIGGFMCSVKEAGEG